MAIRRLLPLLVTAALLTGCGLETPRPVASPQPTATSNDNGVAALPAKEILRRAITALERASSFRMKGNIRVDGKRFVIDIKVLRDDIRGTYTVGDAKMELIAVGGQWFARGNRAFLVQAAGARDGDLAYRVLGKKWFRIPPGDKNFRSYFDVKKINFLTMGPVVKGKPKTVAGVPTIPLVEHGAVTYVATTGTPYPLLVQTAEKERISFSDFSVPFKDVVAPRPANIVDLPS